MIYYRLNPYATMHVPRSDRSLNFIARGCSLGTVLLYIPVFILVLMLGACIFNPYIAASVTSWVLYLAHLMGLSPITLVLLTAAVPVLHALLLHSNRRHGIGGGRWILYSAVFCAPVAFGCLYYLGLSLLTQMPLTDYERIPLVAPLMEMSR